jgi:hypothetical protein
MSLAHSGENDPSPAGPAPVEHRFARTGAGGYRRHRQLGIPHLRQLIPNRLQDIGFKTRASAP